MLILILIIYTIFHIPAFVMLRMGLKQLKTNPTYGKKLLIGAGVYFIIGGGICGALLM
ncbi:MAG: hypothetical protein ACU4F9_05000 [Arcticibacter sp.]